jgi:hypothetical protein
MKIPASVATAIQQYVVACQLEAILDVLLAVKTPANYVTIAKVLGLFSGGAQFAKLLGETQVADHKAKRPIRSSLVISSETGLPGRGYFSHLRQLGYQIGTTPQDELKFWEAQMLAIKAL